MVYTYFYYYYFYSGSDTVPENTGNLAKSISSDLNEISDTTDQIISNMSKKKSSHIKENVVLTYPDGSINYDGILFLICYIYMCICIIYIV